LHSADPRRGGTRRGVRAAHIADLAPLIEPTRGEWNEPPEVAAQRIATYLLCPQNRIGDAI